MHVFLFQSFCLISPVNSLCTATLLALSKALILSSELFPSLFHFKAYSIHREGTS